jgi:heme a synthase
VKICGGEKAPDKVSTARQMPPIWLSMTTTITSQTELQTSHVRLASAGAIASWLGWVAVLVFLMVVVGGITRLTESGLSMTRWEPISGIIPPLNDAEWQAEFAAYQQIPEYQEINRVKGMGLAEFKQIYFWEYLHRVLGRLIGLAFAVPLLWFALKRAIPAGYGWRLTALLALGGLQGTIGWWMVASGLVERTDVSHFRLATHLLTALFILGGLIWTMRDLRALDHNPRTIPARLTGFGLFAAIILFIQLLLGAWVAGLNAGYISNSWPLMNERFYPAGVDWGQGALFALTHDPFLMHFLHRWWAWIVFAVLLVVAGKVKRAGNRRASIAIHATLGTQILLGIATVVFNMNIVLAVLHQAAGALLVASLVWGLHVLGSRRTQTDKVSA